MFTIKRINLLAAACLFAFVSGRAQDDFSTGPVDTGVVVADLVSDVAAIRPGQSFEVALRLKMDPHWHVYWINPGDTGLSPQVDWELPEGFEAGELRFPYPHRIPTPPLVSYGYEGEVFLLSTITAPDDLQAGASVELKAATSWLVCEESCIPGDANLSLSLPVAASAESVAPTEFADEIAETRRELPVEAEGATVAYEELGDSIVFTIDWQGFEGEALEDAYFFVEQESIVNSAAAQTFDLAGSQLRVAVPKSEYFDDTVEGYTGVLYSGGGFAAADGAKAIRLHRTDAAVGGGAKSGSAAESPYAVTFGQALLYAFLGGIILNLMPCVFPVLSIKVLGFVQQSGEDKAKILSHGIAFTVGVLVSFWALAGTLIALRSAGESLGWGFQLQQPEFVIALLVLMFLFGLSLSGVFEMGTSAISLAGKVKSEGYGGSFFSGVVATAVATPCTGPFMGQALGYALTLSAVQSLSIFTLLALGMAAPYLILSANPALINKLPRPGAWMETFKQAMAFPMFATCAWLIWLLGTHVGNDGLLWVLGGLLVVAMGAWIYGRWSVPWRKPTTRRLATAIAVVVGVGGVLMMLPAAEEEGGHEALAWQPYSPELVSSLANAGKPVFVDFTADWCLTCKANEARVFTSDAVLETLKASGVELVQADWTKRDPVITKALEKFGRSGVPLYLLYDGKGSEPRVLPQLLSPGLVLEALSEIE